MGRFAPSPTGPLHAGSVVAALASWLDARAHGGRWLLRLEDLDHQRCRAEYSDLICAQLLGLGLVWDGPVSRQTERQDHYQAALQQLTAAGHIYGCGCSRASIAAKQPRLGASGEAVYPGTCAASRPKDAAVRALRLRVGTQQIHFLDRACGVQMQDLASQCGDYVLQRADGPFSYHLACVVDDAAAGISHVVRGEDLLPLTARQIHLQGLLGLSSPRYLHVPLLNNQAGEKLSKQTGAASIDLQQPIPVLTAAALHLGLGRIHAPTVPTVLAAALSAWQQRISSAA